ncbi:Glycosyl hydrolases family 16 [Bryocella elongata]|uniref:Glycosyl hydrolases family 16 n=1 Tax=Bryocella elongata TaxID=863522 RepID=A0A1H6BYI6_9BACT|nr:glycoside hydrolase family 16 protein [Bryocella elongata]SEG65722.1 Glycosyl hydrolases family 16 [Bryocella elongata]
MLQGNRFSFETLLFVLLGLASPVPGQSAKPRTAAPQASYKLLWSDEFNGPAHSLPSQTDWNFEQGPGPSSNHEAQTYCLPGSSTAPCSAGKPNTFEDGHGHLVIRAIHSSAGWSSARLNSFGKHELLYGRVEARIRMTSGNGFWPAFWLLGNDHATASWPRCGEQDIMEWVQSYTATATSSTVHGPGYSGSHGVGSTFTFPHGGKIDDRRFHTYGMTWSPNRMEFYRDDPSHPYLVVTPDSLPTGATWVYDHPFFVILNFAIGTQGFAGPTDATTPKQGEMLVDYVRLYQAP